MNLAVLVSGGGTNLQTIIDHIATNHLRANIRLVVSDNADAFALERATKAGIPTLYIPKGESLSDTLYEKLKSLSIDFIVLAGFLSILSSDFCSKWNGKILNIHPSLLPKYGGKGMYGNRVHQAVIANKETESGATVHFVTQEIDKGQIITQKSCPVLPTDTPSTLAEKVHKIEHQILIEALQKLEIFLTK